MRPTAEVSERQRKAAYKAWETIRRKQAQAQSVNAAAEPDAKPKVKSPKAKRNGIIVADYPSNWDEIGIEIRNRSRNSNGDQQCECRGECLKHQGRCEELNGMWAMHRRSRGKVKIRFTIAHLCHTPRCDDNSHLRAMCEPCHLIYDLRCRQRGLCGEDAVEWALQQSQN